MWLRQVLGLFKLRIGVVIAFTALAGWAVTPGPQLAAWQVVVLGLAVLLSSASAGAFNQYVESDLDARMKRTRKRAFVTGALPRSRLWLWVIGGLVAGSTAAAWWALNPWAALYTFLGAFVYAVVYTVWLKRRTWLNIVVGGLAGSFAVLAGAAAVDPAIGAVPLILALVLFLWTPPHFWSLAMAYRKDYEAAGVPMLPVVVGDARSAQAIFAHTVAAGWPLAGAGIHGPGLGLLRRCAVRRRVVRDHQLAADARSGAEGGDGQLPRVSHAVESAARRGGRGWAVGMTSNRLPRDARRGGRLDRA